ncbi:gamma-tubulin complex component 2-like protein [Sarcoptes scabiei]|uniref:Gamma-tubulin complex component 2-like protein n=1 Tax=Sarcoptes scabiei TaxID=52283 RepID=A0A132AHZ4_SARSC|nr:gamma-tubulin complex component 2-like protein [Sarcoptes scabiei]
MRLKEISPKKNPFLRHTVHGYLSDNNSISCKYNLLVKDLLFIFQGLKSKHIDFNDEKISHQSERSELFHPNEIYFAQRLSVLGQCFRTIKTYSKCRSKKGGALVSVVYDMMHHGDPIVKECLRKILSKVVKPIRKMLNHWIFFGELKDEYREFFIAINDKATHTTITSSNNVFWFDQYTVNKSMLPGFISKLQAYKILITGKAISMLREVSMNKVSVVLPLYDQLKNSFENSNLETLFDQKYSYQANEFARLLDYVYREISQKALSILNAKYMLHQHFIAHKRFLLLEQGDFMSFLMELLYPLVTRSTNKIRVYTLSQTLENAIRKTCAQYEPTEILSRIDIFFDQNLQYKNAWDIFVLNYKIDGPIGTIFNEQKQSYRIFVDKMLG